MISQKWFVSKEKQLFGVTYCPKKIYAAALLLPGYGMHLCDVDYFMSKLAKKLYDSGIYVLLLDCYGHGDSAGVLQDCTIRSLKDDIAIGMEHCKTVSDNLYCFSRGLIANLLTSLPPYIQIIGLSPVCIKKELLCHIQIPGERIELCKFIPGDDYVAFTDFDKEKLCLIEMIGGRIRHVHGQTIHPDILHYIFQNDHVQILRQRNHSQWMFFEPDEANLYKVYNHKDVTCRPLMSYFKTSVYRDAIWQYRVINEIAKIITVKKDEVYADTFSD